MQPSKLTNIFDKLLVIAKYWTSIFKTKIIYNADEIVKSKLP